MAKKPPPKKKKISAAASTTVITAADATLATMLAHGIRTLPGGKLPDRTDFTRYGNDLSEGDAVIVNDPYQGGMHLPDNHRAGCAGLIPAPDCADAQVALWAAMDRGDEAQAAAPQAPPACST